jgi:type III pantothenate kinase
MLLAIDIGNTHTVIGLFNESGLLNHWRISSHPERTEDEIGVLLMYLLEKDGYNRLEIDSAAISSVVPNATPIYNFMCRRYLNAFPLLIDSTVELGIKIRYLNPGTVGSDRLCNAVAGIAKYGKPLIIIDFGTATTFDCIDRNGDYLGGVISPGLHTSILALHRNAAKLPSVEMEFPPQLIGRTTDESIQSGILNGAVCMTEGMVTRLKNELGTETRVVATGGLAAKISRRTTCIEHVDIFLNLEGIVSVYNMNRERVKRHPR